jgi:hypothetical protein
MIGLLALALVLGAASSIVVTALRLGIGPVPTSRAVREAVLGLVPPESKGTAYELGAGWGGLARALARRCPGLSVTAVEASFVPWAFAALVQRVQRVPNLRVVRGDFYAHPLGEADLMVCYLFTGAMSSLASRLRMKPGAVLISAVFALPGREADAMVRAEDLYRSPVYRYRVA